jgi:hypothetical protein
MVLAELIRLRHGVPSNHASRPMGDLEERETISSRSRPAARSVTPAPIIEDHAQRSRIPIATASSETEVAGEGLHGDRQAMVEAVLTFIERRTAELEKG